MCQLTIQGLTDKQIDLLLDKCSQMFGVSSECIRSTERERYNVIVKGCEQQLYVIENFVSQF